jgi:2,3-bisphosphoglycerate-independent phosphoglycerate mutase
LTEQAYQFAFLHVKAVDDTGHDRKAALKVNEHLLIHVALLFSADHYQ